MAFEQTWRWFGPNEPISLREIKQTGATGIVTALHQIPTGKTWPKDEILKRKEFIESEGLVWSVVESVPVHEDIKKGTGNCKEYIENYKLTIRNLGQCGIKTVCYNFMPILDWSRTNLKVIYKDGSITTRFIADEFAAFDLFILKRKLAEKSYSNEQIEKATKYYNSLDENHIEDLVKTILLGLPGSLEAYTLEEFKKVIQEYDGIGDKELRENLYYFIKEIIPVAEESGVMMAIHPDDPPFHLLGLPRIVSTLTDLNQIINVIDTPNNGITLCTGSLGAGYNNDLVNITRNIAHRISFVHLRNVIRNEDGDFLEDNHLDGDIDIYEVMKILLLEQKKRITEGRKDYKMPMRPDHGHLMIPDQNKTGIYPGYSLFGRMRGLAELRGLELGITRSMGL